MDLVKSEKIREDSLYKAFQLVLNSLKEKHDLNTREVMELIAPQDKENMAIPVSIIQNRKLGVLESVVVYLKEEIGLKYSEIARLLSRDDRTIWNVYNYAKNKRRRKK